MNFRLSNPKDIKKFFEKQNSLENVKEMLVEIEDIEPFLEDILDGLKNEESDWPLAVNPALIVDWDNLNDCKIRARNIVELMIDRELYGLSVLDFGCGDGLVASELMERGAKKSVGYDIQSNKFWENTSAVLTTSFQDVYSNAPYDFILLYDVLDHIMDEAPNKVLEKLATVLNPGGIMVLRCHPWISRHGAHLYTQLNRAFAHVIFDEILLKKHYEITPTRKVVHPMNAYKKWIEKANLNIVKEEKIQEPVEDYFLNNELFKTLIQKHFNNSPFQDYKEGKGDLSRVMSFHFVDYILKK